MNISKFQKHLSESEAVDLTKRQRELHEDFLKGGEVEYLGYKFNILPGVFKPRPDSIAVVENMKINLSDRVLDVCCGSGVIGIMAIKKGAASVLGLDLNPVAVECAKRNAEKHGCADRYEARVSDVLSALQPEEKFNVITINPPFRNIKVAALVERTTWDEGMEVHRKFFSEIGRYLAPGGRIYFAQANFAELDQVEKILGEFGWEVKLIGHNPLEAVPGLEFYGFEVFSRYINFLGLSCILNFKF